MNNNVLDELIISSGNETKISEKLISLYTSNVKKNLQYLASSLNEYISISDKTYVKANFYKQPALRLKFINSNLDDSFALYISLDKKLYILDSFGTRFYAKFNDKKFDLNQLPALLNKLSLQEAIREDGTFFFAQTNLEGKKLLMPATIEDIGTSHLDQEITSSLKPYLRDVHNNISFALNTSSTKLMPVAFNLPINSTSFNLMNFNVTSEDTTTLPIFATLAAVAGALALAGGNAPGDDGNGDTPEEINLPPVDNGEANDGAPDGGVNDGGANNDAPNNGNEGGNENPQTPTENTAEPSTEPTLRRSPRFAAQKEKDEGERGALKATYNLVSNFILNNKMLLSSVTFVAITAPTACRYFFKPNQPALDAVLPVQNIVVNAVNRIPNDILRLFSPAAIDRAIKRIEPTEIIPPKSNDISNNKDIESSSAQGSSSNRQSPHAVDAVAPYSHTRTSSSSSQGSSSSRQSPHAAAAVVPSAAISSNKNTQSISSQSSSSSRQPSNSEPEATVRTSTGSQETTIAQHVATSSSSSSSSSYIDDHRSGPMEGVTIQTDAQENPDWLRSTVGEIRASSPHSEDSSSEEYDHFDSLVQKEDHAPSSSSSSSAAVYVPARDGQTASQDRSHTAIPPKSAMKRSRPETKTTNSVQFDNGETSATPIRPITEEGARKKQKLTPVSTSKKRGSETLTPDNTGLAVGTTPSKPSRQNTKASIKDFIQDSYISNHFVRTEILSKALTEFANQTFKEGTNPNWLYTILNKVRKDETTLSIDTDKDDIGFDQIHKHFNKQELRNEEVQNQAKKELNLPKETTKAELNLILKAPTYQQGYMHYLVKVYTLAILAKAAGASATGGIDGNWANFDFDDDFTLEALELMNNYSAKLNVSNIELEQEIDNNSDKPVDSTPEPTFLNKISEFLSSGYEAASEYSGAIKTISQDVACPVLSYSLATFISGGTNLLYGNILLANDLCDYIVDWKIPSTKEIATDITEATVITTCYSAANQFTGSIQDPMTQAISYMATNSICHFATEQSTNALEMVGEALTS